VIERFAKRLIADLRQPTVVDVAGAPGLGRRTAGAYCETPLDRPIRCP
jgi:hypothetical protein